MMQRGVKAKVAVCAETCRNITELMTQVTSDASPHTAVSLTAVKLLHKVFNPLNLQ